MTEYETAQLALSESMRIQGLIELVQTQAEHVVNEITNFTSYLFGYLLVAYFIGANLTRVQVTILNVLYIVSIAATVFQMMVSISITLNFLSKVREVIGRVADGIPSSNTTYVVFLFLLYTALVLASLYFMWSVRHPKKE